MKNVHLIATDKPSRLFIVYQSKMFLSEPPKLSFSKVGGKIHKIEGNELYQPQHIYITDNSEIKVGDYYLCKLSMKPLRCIGDEYFNNVDEEKIIMTTDQDLIKEDVGIQSIDDEFLQWFCSKNGKVDFVEMTYENDTDLFGYDFSYFKITIPKEEPKPHSFCETPNEKCTMNYCEDNGCQNRNRELVEPKEESNIIDQWLEKNDNSEIDKQVEEAAENHWKMQYIMALDESTKPYIIQDFIAGAKWQQEQDKNKYSEEEVKNLLIECCGEISCEDGILVGKFPEELAEWIDKKLEERRDTFIKSVCKNCNQPIEMHSTSSKMCFDRLTHYE